MRAIGWGLSIVLLALLMAVSAGAQASGPSTGIFIADSGNHRIVRVDGITGVGWTTFGTRGSGHNEFVRPTGIFVDGSSRIYVSDRFNDRVVRVNDMTGAGWTGLGYYPGLSKNQFHEPTGIFVDVSMRIYVADWVNNRIVRVNDMSGAGWTTLGTVTVFVHAEPNRVHGAAVSQFDVELSRLYASAARVFGAGEGMTGLLPGCGHERIVRLFGEEQSMPTKRVGCFCASAKTACGKAVAPASAGGLRAGVSPHRFVGMEARRRAGFLREEESHA